MESPQSQHKLNASQDLGAAGSKQVSGYPDNGEGSTSSFAGCAGQICIPTAGIRRYKPTRRPPSRSVLHIDTDKHVYFTGDVSPLRQKQNQLICCQWYSELGYNVQKNIERAGFGELVKILGLGNADKLLLQALSERWWDTTHTFHFDNVGELTITPKDFSGLTGLPVCGKKITWEQQSPLKDDVIERFFGRQILNLLNADVTKTWGDLYGEYYNFKTRTKTEIDQLTRVFLLALLGSVLCTDNTGFLNLGIMHCLSKIEDIGKYNWGGAGLGTMYKNMDAMSRGRTTTGCIWKLWEVWACLYLKPIGHSFTQTDNKWPIACRWIGSPSLSIAVDYRALLRNLIEDEVNFDPWHAYETSLPHYVRNSVDNNGKRMLLPSITGYAWYLAERVSRQSLGFLKPRIPTDPPLSMLGDYPFTDDEIEGGILGWNASKFVGLNEDEYVAFCKTYISYDQYPPSPLEIDDEAVGVEVTEIPIPPWSINVVTGDDEYRLQLLDVPRNEPSQYCPLPQHVKAVSADTANTLLRQIAGITAIASTQGLNASKSWQRVKQEAAMALTEKDEQIALLTDDLDKTREEMYGVKSLLRLLRSNSEGKRENNLEMVSKEGTADEVAEDNNRDQYKEKSRGEIGARSGGESCDEDGEADIDEDWYPSSTKTWRLPPTLGEENDTKRSRCD